MTSHPFNFNLPPLSTGLYTGGVARWLEPLPLCPPSPQLIEFYTVIAKDPLIPLIRSVFSRPQHHSQSVDDDFTPQDYRLQYRRGNSSQYEDAYIGKDTEFLVLHLDPHIDHLFRVCARGEGRTEWSPWSIPQTGYTTLAPHEWLPGVDGYILSSRKNIAMRNDSSPGHGGVLYSNSPTYFCGQTLTFKITAAGQTDKRDSLGVCADNRTDTDSLQRDQAVCISTNGTSRTV
ncbi:cytokine receptor-like factor 3 [Sinocyclocheilus rhinocerous]|uniref:cytokine receptor-like factor 3 n=1 Tax=Sinocyclocheilus rhinocerous TaxID=307959 RepID=UPI0007BA5780|nr:PREDICTED: cytokine receptor-like factor 3 [Sinocyclocheilus rhinocerous]